MPRPSAGYACRGATVRDLAAVLGFLDACDVHDWGEPDFTEDALRQEWSHAGLDLSTDTWLVLDPADEVVGYGWLLARAGHTRLDGRGAVHPKHRGRGVGTYLLDRMEARAAEHRKLAPPDRPVQLGVDTNAPDRAVRRMLEARGFRPVRHFWRMDIELEPGLPWPDPPSGISLRNFVRDADAVMVHAAIEESFAGTYAWVPRTFGEWSERRLDDPSFDPSLWWVALDGDEVTGALLAEITGGFGWVGIVCVRERWRGRRIGQSLLRTALAELKYRGIHRVSLEVDSENETGATRLYERVGMRVARRYDSYGRVLAPTASAPQR
jgi:mycothiol synthase